MDDLFSKYRLSEALMAVYKLFWDEFSAWYLEIVKPAYQQPIDRATYEATLGLFDSLLRLLHPFMPFITEELWQALQERNASESIMISLQPNVQSSDSFLIADFERVKEIIAGVRTIRLQKNIPQKEKLSLKINGEHSNLFDDIIKKLCNLESISYVSEGNQSTPVGDLGGLSSSFLVGTTEYAVPMGNLINVEEEIAKMEAEIKYFEGFINSVMVKRGNERLVANAKPEIVENERKKKADAESKIASLKEGIAGLRKK